ncbi:MAG: thermonuclease family protein [Opitutae bacterium]|nr:thermonuclease family protein [Opitutae bacterium]
MPLPALALTPKTYAQLRDAVIAVVVQGRRAIDRAWLETYHETGRLIHEHVLLFRDRADYGAKTYAKLAEDTAISRRTLQECVQFYRCYPIWRAHAKLDWGHYKVLISVGDDDKRRALEAEAIKQGWNTRDLQTRVRAYNAVALAADDPAPAATTAELLQPRCGVPGLRRIVERRDGPGIDLGFKNYAAVPAAPPARLKAGDIVRWTEDGVQKIADATPDQLFTYRATLRKIIDGDTLDITLALAPGFTRDLRLRLRGLDCPELATAAGRAAKAFVENLVRIGNEVIVCTTKPDKYDRYLADVFIGEAAGSKLKADSLAPAAAGTVYLNNALLSAGHATRYDGGAKEE